jgi:RND family efflux transporter MFP subunit
MISPSLSPVLRLLVLPVTFTCFLGCQKEKPAPKTPPPPKVTVSKPISDRVQSFRDYNGYIEPLETVNIRTRVKGFLQKVLFQEGAEVKKGDPLYEIDPREYQAMLTKAQADLVKSQSELRKAIADEDRARRSREKSVISEEEYVQKAAAREVAQAVVKQAEAQVAMANLDVSFTKIEAPIEGRVNRTLITPGNLVGYNEATLLTTIVRVDRVYVYFDVPERHLIDYQLRAREKKMSMPTEGTHPVEVGVEGETGHPHLGVINFRENRVDTSTGTIRLRGELPNQSRILYPGLYARVRVPLGDPEEKLMLPETALMSDQRGRFIYVVKADNTVEYRPITIGPRKSGLISIETGLSAEDRVIVNGLQRARPGAQVQAEEIK